VVANHLNLFFCTLFNSLSIFSKSYWQLSIWWLYYIYDIENIRCHWCI